MVGTGVGAGSFENVGGWKYMKKKIRILLVLLLCAFMAFASALSACSSVHALETETIEVTGTYKQSDARSMLDLINTFRSDTENNWYYDSNGEKVYPGALSAYTYDYELEKIAMQRAMEIAVSFSHTRPDGSSCFTADTSGIMSAENIAWGTRTAENTFVLWQENDQSYSGQGHRRAMLSSDYTAIGIACVQFNGGYFWVQEFGRSSGASETDAVNGEETVSISVISSDMTVNNAVEELNEYTEFFDISETKDLPSVKASVTYGSGTFEAYVQPDWTVSSGSSYVTLNGDSVTGRSTGRAVLTGKVGSSSVTYNALVNIYLEDLEYENKVTTASGTAPELPEKAVLIWSDGLREEKEIVFESYDESLYKKREGGTFTVKGKAEGVDVDVEVTVTPAAVESIDDVEVIVLQNEEPELPDTVTVHWSNGDESEEKVVWEEKTYGTVGTVKVTGTLENGETVTAVVTVKKPTQDMYRLYNRNSGEHFYTADSNEKDYLVKAGWTYEGIGWVAPSYSKDPVYRLYNKNAGDHHYTMNKAERDHLISLGWKDEGIGWYSDPNKTVPLYRQYNPNKFANNHNYTTAKNENDKLISLGWRGEGIGWYAVGEGKPVVKQKVQYTPVYYSQRDSRWAYKSYAIQGCSIGSNGCRPTNIAMAFSGILGTAVYPDEVADWLYYNTDQWCTRVKGGSGLAAPMAAEHWGVECKGLSNPDEIRQALKDGCIILGDVGRGTFVAGSGSHALTLFGYNEADDTTMVYDSYSTNLNGRYTISSLWNQRSTDPDDANGGYLFYAFYK